MAFDGNLLNLLSALPAGGDLSRIMGMLGGLAKPGEKGADMSQLLSLMQTLQKTAPVEVPAEPAEECPSPCDTCREPCPRAGLPLPGFQEAKQAAGQWYHF